MHCSECAHWLTERRTVYADGIAVSSYKAEVGTGRCSELAFVTKADFGCVNFTLGSEHVVTEIKDCDSWRHWEWIACPDSAGTGLDVGGNICRRCAGTGRVRRYGDGYIGDEQTQLHQREIDARKAEKAAISERGTILAEIEVKTGGYILPPLTRQRANLL